jgi:putative nucleotidyltransferase with HDIG domain
MNVPPQLKTNEKLQQRMHFRRIVWMGSFVALFATFALAAVLSPQLLASQSNTAEVGQVAEQDLLANQNLSYVSEILTEQKRQEAAVAVREIYALPDTSVARKQMELLRNTLNYITSVRADTYATREQKKVDLSSLEHIQLSPGNLEALLILNDTQWIAVEQEAISVLEQLMRQPIQPDGVDTARSTIPPTISLDLSTNQAVIVNEMVSVFLAANSFFDESLTEAARENARQAVVPVTRSFIDGQTVVRRGEILDESDVEALTQLGLVGPKRRWQDLAGAIALVLLASSFQILYLRRTPAMTAHFRNFAIISIIFLVFLASARLSTYGHVVIPYAFPLAGYGMLVTALFGSRVAMITSLPLSILVAYGMPNALDLTIYYILSNLFGILALGRARRIGAFIWAGVAATLAGWLVILAYRLIVPTTDWVGMFSLGAAALFSGMASAALALILQFILSQILGTTTPMQLMELTRPDHPLLQYILKQAPGTYQHSLQVANLVEQAAERISADTLLSRVGALYHDAGKAENPVYFIENQLPGFVNPHDSLEPEESAEIIIQHVSDGLKLAKNYRLPRPVRDFILQHHGTTLTRYQYVMAVAGAGGREEDIDANKFRYLGPKPQSRETAILMLADACEATVRADRPKDDNELRTMIRAAIAQRVSEGELNDADLTLRDLDAIADSFTSTLRGLYHPRVKYPQLESLSQQPALALPVGSAKEKVKEATVPTTQVKSPGGDDGK